ncbi:1-hydroxycarotenoid 3,4-desaturase CrtD [Pseudacidovorax sp. RU35E]|uniref:1-hydroxycarotenoid 3,4-desaturase CrtD n=1 Tax=Pseudacidovorax sp. RU35E TaxID=1907403 RepID=UPI000954FE6B|nr:1-hydroxycarotenoid 3,4-desaturase CrtD [Pseudacidovorax sp. RU35E]SIR60617.1 1-hydroxycarotenoid 3,4-desaturase [Pseudacidovorax sp. RU35E]
MHHDPSSRRSAASHAPGTARAVVVGAGAGGLSAAAVLAHAGLDVTVLDRAAGPGGKACLRQVGPHRLDAGPTVLTMRWVFEQLFDTLGQSLAPGLALTPCRVLARHAWGPAASDRLDLLADLQASTDAIGTFSGAAEARRYLAFCAQAQAMYEALESTFIAASRPTPLGLTTRMLRRGLSGARALSRIQPFQTLWQALGGHFHDPRLRQLFGRYATYCGSSPFDAPATLMLVAHVEREAVWQVEGGMHRVAEVLADAAREQGAQLRFGHEVREITVRGGRASGVRLADGEVLPADIVVFNGDADALAQGLLGGGVRTATGAAPLRPQQRSLSAVTWHQVARAEGFALSHHNVFFSDPAHDGYRREFDALQAGRLPASPTVYLCAQDRLATPDGQAPTGPERLMLLVNAPARADTHPLDEKELTSCEQQIRHRLAQAGLTLQPGPWTAERTTPTQFAAAYPGSAGALYGRASQGWQATFQRPAQRSAVPGLYLAGGSVHPGPGVPMASLSGQLAAQQILEDLASTSRSRRGATRGGTSTR